MSAQLGLSMRLSHDDLPTTKVDDYKRQLGKARRQGFCDDCAEQTALGMVTGLHYLGDICKECWKRLNPPLEAYWHHNERKCRIKAGWSAKPAAKMTVKKCQQCRQEFVPRRADAKFCTDRCRKVSKRVRDHA